MTVRPATVGDEAALAELNAVVQQMHHEVAPEWFKPPEIAAIVSYFREALRSDALRTFVAEADGAVRGYALARLPQRPETPWTDGGLSSNSTRSVSTLEAGAWGESSSTR